MINKEIINYSLRSLLKSKSRSFLTIFSIMIGITTLFIFVSFGLGLFQYINALMTDSSANKLIVQAKGNSMPGLDDTFQLTDDDIKAIKKVPGVLSVTGSYFKPIEIKQDTKRKYVFLISYDPKNPLMLDLSDVGIKKGRLLRKSDSKKVLLGANYLKNDVIFPDSYDIGKKILVENTELKVIGFLDEVGNPQDDSNIYVTNDYFSELFPNVTNYAMIIIEVNNEEIPQTIERIEEKLRKERDQEKGKEDFYVKSFQDLIQSYTSALNIVVAFIIIIALISVIVSMVNTSNTMITSVLERYREIGVLKSIGARNSEIFYIFLFESSVLGFIAGCVGVFFGWLFSYSAGLFLKSLNWGFLSPSFSSYLFIVLILFATITGGLSGVIPANYASKINTTDALRYE